MTSSGARGTSLIELLVVIAVLAVIVGAALLSVDLAGAGRQVEREARRLEALVALACERAELTGRGHGIHFREHGYGFSVRMPVGWRIETYGELRPRELHDALALQVSRDDLPLEASTALPADPQAICEPSGELAPFSAEIRAGAAGPALRLRAGIDGRLELVEPDADGS